MKTFEYLSVETDSRLYDNKLNNYGADGWELINLYVECGWRLYTFKREKQ